MGNSISTHDHESQLLAYNTIQYSREVAPAEPDLEFGPVYRSAFRDELYEGYHEGVASEVCVKTNMEMFDIGYRLAGGDSNFIGQRVWRVAETPTERSEAEKLLLPKGYKPSGYIERKDGSIDRFDYEWLSWAKGKEAFEAFGRGLVHKNISKQGDKMGIFAVNRPEWSIAQWGLYSQNLVVVPLYATLGPDSIEFIIKNAALPAVIVSKENFPTIVKTLPKVKDSNLKHIILIDSLFDGLWGNTLDVITEEQREMLRATGCDIELIAMSEIIAAGMDEAVKAAIPRAVADASTLAFVMYTSGTSGTPKGVMITNQNVATTCSGVNVVLTTRPHMVYFSYLPLAHIFEVVVNTLFLASGSSVAYSQGDVRQIVSDLQASRPHVLCGVPRIWTKFFQSAWASIDAMGFIKRFFIYRAYNYQLSQLFHQKKLDAGYDNQIFKTIREKIGLDRAEIMITGAAPSPAYLVNFMRILIGTNIHDKSPVFYQGYGMTETTAGTCVPHSEDFTIGHCGHPLPHCDARLASVSDMGYLYTDENPRGELLLSGPSIFTGYYNNKEETDKALVPDSSGRLWLRTGDIVRYNKNSGSISIIDRKKALLKLAQGEYVSLEKVEGKYGQSPLVGQICVYGNSFKSMLVAIVVPNVLPLYDLALTEGWWNTSLPKPVPGQLTDEHIEQFKAIVEKHGEAITAWMKVSLSQCEAGLLGFEKIKSFYVDVDYDALGQVLTEKKELLTPTMKLRRQPIAKFYIDHLKDMYTKIGEPAQDGESWW